MKMLFVNGLREITGHNSSQTSEKKNKQKNPTPSPPKTMMGIVLWKVRTGIRAN